MNSRTYEIGPSKITLLFGDISTSKAESLVSSDDYLLSMSGGVSAAIRHVAGPRVAADASKMVPARVGDVIVSTAGDLPAKYIFHAITIGSQGIDLPPDAIVRQTTQRVMNLLPVLGCASVAFPAIGGGSAGIPYEIVASEMAGALVGFLLDAQEAYNVELYLMDRFGQLNRDDFFMFFEAFAARKLGLSTLSDASTNELKPPSTITPSMDAKQMAEAERHHQVYMMLRHLDVRRNQIEADLLHVLGGQELPQDKSFSQLKEQLDEIQSLRRSYEAELIVTDKAEQPVIRNSVFVSSTSADLKPHRQAVRNVINTLRLTFIGMEEFAPTAQAPVDLIRRKVNEGQVYLGIMGMRYGYVDPGTGLSMTELEYRQAIASDKRICMFVMDQNAPILASMVEDDPIRFAKLIDFRSRIMKAHTCALFTDPADLAQKAEATLREPWPA
jgi:O-acetyl-ADP-ribose deacetylase (regulator of RNase III)/transcriptional regulator of met regulon